MNKKVLAIISIIALVAILGVCLVACNADSYEKKLDKAGYAVSVLQGEDAKDKADTDAAIEWLVSGAKSAKDYVMVIKFKNTDDAKEFEKNAVTGGALGFTLVCERSGNIVFYGSESGVKAAK